MKKFLILSAFSVLATLGFHQSAMANCYCPQGMLSQGLCYVPQGQNNSMRPIGYAICPASPRQSKYDAPPPPVTKDICEARPHGGKACLTVYISDPNYKFKLTETNAQASLLYFRDYHIDGNTIKAETHLKDGIRHGVFKTFHENGQPKGLGNFVNGQLQGEYKVYDENGRLIEIEHYKDDENVLEISYQNGKKHGQEIEYGYLNNGKKGLTQYVLRTAQWQNGIKHGEEKFFEVVNKKGKTKLVKTVMWQNGKVISQ